MTRSSGVTVDVLTYLARLEPARTFSIDDLKVACPATAQTSLQSAMYRIVKNDRWPVEVIDAGHLWRNAVAPITEAELADGPEQMSVVEHMGSAAVLRDGAGVLWLARRIGVAD